MKRQWRLGLAVGSALAVCLSLIVSVNAESGNRALHVCGSAALGFARCHSLVVVNGKASPAATTSPTGYGPAQLQGAYSLPSSSAGSGQTIAIVDAYNDPAAVSDINTYRST